MNEDTSDLVDLASERLGGAVLFANDELFAAKENLLKPEEPVWIEGKYTDVGKWMDGWETRRRREPGHDLCIVRLGLPGALRVVVVDTTHFRGNYPESCSLEICALPGYPTAAELLREDLAWREILGRVPLQGHAKNVFRIEGEAARSTHARFHIYPDGGVARLRLYGEVFPDWERLERLGSEIDLVAVENGGRVLSASDMFFGNRTSLILPGPPRGMHDGWETRRRRGPGHDWALLRLGRRGHVCRVEVDTTHFKGNAPGSCWIEGCENAGGAAEPEALSALPWRPILPATPLCPHTLHRFDTVSDSGPFTHARLNVHPDGGVARLRLFGRVED
jgi:allantoicase